MITAVEVVAEGIEVDAVEVVVVAKVEVEKMINNKDGAILSYSVVPNIKDNMYGRGVQTIEGVMPIKEQMAVAKVVDADTDAKGEDTNSHIIYNIYHFCLQ